MRNQQRRQFAISAWYNAPRGLKSRPCYLRNQQRRRFAISAWYNAPRGLKSRLQLENQADTTKSPPQQTAKEPNEDSDAEPSSLQALPPVVSNIAGYNLAQDKIIYGWDVQRLRRGLAIKAEKEKKKQLAMEAGLASRASSSLKIC